MRHRKLATCCFGLGVALAMAPTDARAAAGLGWLQLDGSSSRSVSKTIAGNDFAIGYTTSWGFNAYSWDLAEDTIAVSCETRTVHRPGQPDEQIYSTSCPTLPGTKLSTSTTSMSTRCNELPCTKTTTTIDWDVPNTGAMAAVDGSFNVPLTLFDKSWNLFALKLSGTANTSGPNEIRGDVYILGQKVVSSSHPVSSQEQQEEKELDRYCARFVRTQTQFLVGGVPITVTSTVDGCVYAKERTSWRNNVLAGTLTPGANVDGTVSASAGFKVGGITVKAGVSGSLTIIDASLPVTVSAAPKAGGTVGANGQLAVRALDGNIKVSAKACVKILGKNRCALNEKRTLFDWTGMSSSSTIFSMSQPLPY